MADLYLADDRLLRCKVAVKILRDDSPDSRARFLREAEVLSNVHHENLVDVFARGTVQSSGMPYTVLRYLPGEDLMTRLLEGGPLPWATARPIRQATSVTPRKAGRVASRQARIGRARRDGTGSAEVGAMSREDVIGAAMLRRRHARVKRQRAKRVSAPSDIPPPSA